MSAFAQIRAKFRLWFELLEKQKTAAEVVVSKEIAELHDAIAGLEANFSIVDAKAVKEARDIVVEAKGLEHPLVAKLDAALAVTDKAASDLKAAFEANKKAAQPPAPVVAPQTPGPVQGGDVPPPAAVPDAPVFVAPPVVAPAEPVTPVVDVTGTKTP
jgi:hypothetical protein